MPARMKQLAATDRSHFGSAVPTAGAGATDKSTSKEIDIQMSRFRLIAASFIAVLAMSAVSVASASAHEFYASIAGTIKNTGGTQTFKTSSGTVKCTGETSEGTVPAGFSKTTVEKTKYTGCTGPIGKAEVSEGEVEISAEGFANILKAQTVKLPSLGCTVTTPAQKERKAVTFENKKPKLKVKLALKELEYESSGGLCGSAGKHTGAEYTGEVEVELPGGELEWK